MNLTELCSGFKEKGYPTHVIRDANFDVIGEQVGPNQKPALRFLSAMKYFNKNIAQAAALLVNEDIEINLLMEQYKGGILLCEDAKECMYAINVFLPGLASATNDNFKSRIDPTAIISSDVKVPKYNVIIGPGVVIEDQVIIYPNVEIGAGTRVCAGAVLGSEGVMLCSIKGRKIIIPHCGRLVIGEQVVVMNKSILQKGINNGADTKIGSRTVIGSGCLISHGTMIEEDVLVLDHAVIAGYCHIGPNTFIGAGSFFKNGLEIGRDVHVSPGSIVIEHVADHTKLSGFFAIDRRNSLKLYEQYKMDSL